MIRQDFKEGKTVRVLGLCAGKFVVEGMAKVIRYVPQSNNVYVIRFVGDRTATVERYLDPKAQGNDWAEYVEGLNSGT